MKIIWRQKYLISSNQTLLVILLALEQVGELDEFLSHPLWAQLADKFIDFQRNMYMSVKVA